MVGSMSLFQFTIYLVLIYNIYGFLWCIEERTNLPERSRLIKFLTNPISAVILSLSFAELIVWILF